MARTFYTIVLCLTLGLLATMWLRPGLAQDLINMATGMRAQSPGPVGYDSAASNPTSVNPRNDPFGGTQYGETFGTPVQPTAPGRPSTWPGAPPVVNASGNNAGVRSDFPGENARVNPAANGRAIAPAPVTASPMPGVTVWGGNAGYPAQAAGASGNPAGNYQPQMPAGYSPSSPAGNQLVNPIRQGALPNSAGANIAANPGAPSNTLRTDGTSIAPGVAAAPTPSIVPLPPFTPPSGYGQQLPQAQVNPAFGANPQYSQTQYSQLPPNAYPPNNQAQQPGVNSNPVFQVAQSPAAVAGPVAADSFTAGPTSQNFSSAVDPLAQTTLPSAGVAPPTAGANMPGLQVLPEKPRTFSDTQVVAKIGTAVILGSDVDALVNEYVASNKLEIPPEEKDAFYDIARRKLLKQLVEAKLIYNDAVHAVPAAGMTKIESSINKKFDEERLPELLKANEAAGRQELEAKLRAKGSSLDLERRTFFEKMLVAGWLEQQIKRDEAIPLGTVIGNYQSHLADYEFKAQAKWEELMVSFDKYPDKAAAWSAIAEMGNAVQKGAPFAEVAKANSQGFTSDQGGAYEWTTQGSLTSKELDENIFNLPIGSLSQIITTNRGFHIIRVVDRKAAGRKSFEETQGEIKKQLKNESVHKQIEKYLGELKNRTPVWTFYDDQPGGLDGPKSPQQGVSGIE